MHSLFISRLLTVNEVKGESKGTKRKFHFHLPEEKIVQYIAKIIEVILLVAIGIVIVYTVIDIFLLVPSGLLSEIFGLVGNAFLVVVLLELFQSIVDFGKGRGRSVVYVMDATMSFVLREVIIELINGVNSMSDLLYLASIILLIAFSRFLISFRLTKKRP
ncbi:MAG: phosphate-starvation-inducible PsiE family protein [Sulfolobaceae archaeon]